VAKLRRGLQCSCFLQMDSQAQQGLQFPALVWVAGEALRYGLALPFDGSDTVVQDVLKTSGWRRHDLPLYSAQQLVQRDQRPVLDDSTCTLALANDTGDLGVLQTFDESQDNHLLLIL
jgi:hypothetical protein